MSSCIIGLDLGTSSVKAALYDLEGHELAVERFGLRVTSPEPDWAEQDPREWICGVQEVLGNLVTRAEKDMVQAIGISGQCPGHVLISADGQPLGPAIIWRDRRASTEAAWLASQVSREEALEWVGSASLGDATMPPARLVWLKNHRPDQWRQAWKVLQPKDYLGWILTGEIGSDIHSSFLLFHPQTRQIHPALLEVLEASAEKFPSIRKPTDLLGRITSNFAEVTGLAIGTPVYTGTIDAYCEILAAGGFVPGQAVDVAGTSEMIALGVQQARENPSVFYDRLEGAGGFVCGPTQAGCGLQNWLARMFYSDADGQIDYRQLEIEASAAPPGADGIVFLPYIYGERAPIWDAQATGAFVGLTARHERRHIARAVYESVAYVIRHVLDVSMQASREQVTSVVTCGGGSRSKFWNQVKADVLQKEIQPLQAQASACLGAAILAATSAGAFANLTEAAGKMGIRTESFSPDPQLAGLYDEEYALYRQIYPALHSPRGSE